MLLQIVRTGLYDLPGGTRIRDSTMTSVRTWNELMRIEAQEAETTKTGAEEDKVVNEVFLVSPDDPGPEPDDLSQNDDDDDVDSGLQHPGGLLPPLASVSHLYGDLGEQDLAQHSGMEALRQVSMQSNPDQLANPDFFMYKNAGELWRPCVPVISYIKRASRAETTTSKTSIAAYWLATKPDQAKLLSLVRTDLSRSSSRPRHSLCHGAQRETSQSPVK